MLAIETPPRTSVDFGGPGDSAQACERAPTIRFYIVKDGRDLGIDDRQGRWRKAKIAVAKDSHDSHQTVITCLSTGGDSGFDVTSTIVVNRTLGRWG